MAPETLLASQGVSYVPDLFHYNRRKTRVVYVGDVAVGGDNPIRLQSMTTTPTTDVDATVAQSVRLVNAGCEIVRITAPTLNDARALGQIKKALLAKGIKTPLVADIHFNPECAMEAANHVEKVRVNPGNYADSKIFKTKEYSDSEYQAEIQRVEERFTPLVLKLKALGRSLRIGSNHGSLSDRLMNRYGDSPEGMVESALEFVRICEKNNYYDIILSMKSSNPKVMIAAYRLLAARMAQENMDYPFHLGVTEAGYGEDGRIKSAIGIGSLLNDGIGDTIRVSLTEDPEFEIPVAQQIAAAYQPSAEARGLRTEEKNSGLGARASELGPSFSHVESFYHYARRPTRALQIGPFKIGGDNVVRVINDFSPWVDSFPDGKSVAIALLELIQERLTAGKETLPEILVWTLATSSDVQKLMDCRKALGDGTASIAFLGRFKTPALASQAIGAIDLAYCSDERALDDFIKIAQTARKPLLLEVSQTPESGLTPAHELLRQIQRCEQAGYTEVLLSFNLPKPSELIAHARHVIAELNKTSKTYPFHVRVTGNPSFSDLRIDASIGFGSLFCDGIGDTAQTGRGVDPNQDLALVYNVLQGAGVRITKTEFVSCPSCGRTLFDLQTTTERIKTQTGHLKGVKIAIMGCIVNGPGEMADADFGYVGGAPGRINLYVGKECVEKGIPTEEADNRLIHLIKAHGKWVDPK